MHRFLRRNLCTLGAISPDRRRGANDQQSGGGWWPLLVAVGRPSTAHRRPGSGTRQICSPRGYLPTTSENVVEQHRCPQACPGRGGASPPRELSTSLSSTRDGRAAERGGPGLQAQDDQGGVVGGVTGWEQVREHGVGESFGITCPVSGQGVGEPGEARVDVFAAAFDQTVGVKHEDGALVEGSDSLDPGAVLRTSGQWRVGGLVQELDGPVPLQEHWWGWPALL